MCNLLKVEKRGDFCRSHYIVLHTSPLGAILRRHGVGFHMYVDDTQLYLSMKTTEVEDFI